MRVKYWLGEMLRTSPTRHLFRGAGAGLAALAFLQCSTERSRPPAGSEVETAAAVASTTATAAPAELGDFSPEAAGSFGFAVDNPYARRLREVLFAGDEHRICELVTIPSFEVESAVYVAEPEQGPPVVVSRCLDEQLWGRMMVELERQAGGLVVGKSISIDAKAQSAALAKIQASTATDRAESDRATVEVVARACGAVLRRAHDRGDVDGLDGVTYHAAHSYHGELFAGRAHSPAPGTISSDYVALSAALRAYAVSTPSRRPAIKAELLAKAELLIQRAAGGTR